MHQSYEQAQAAKSLPSTAEYLDAANRNKAFEAWRATLGRNWHKPEEVPENVPQISNEDRSAIERFEFFYDPPKVYTLYISEKKSEATTWTGERLGRVTFGKAFRDNFGGLRVPVWVDAINGRCYSGTYFKSAGNYARIKLTKSKGE